MPAIEGISNLFKKIDKYNEENLKGIDVTDASEFELY